MSTFIDYYFNSDKNLHELSDEINECVGTNLTLGRPHQTEQSWCMFFGMSLDFWAHSDEPDELLDLQKKFKYKIGLTGSKELRCMRVPLFGMLAYLMYHHLEIGSAAIVYNLDRALAMYETRVFDDDGEDLFDTISGKRVEIPQHLTDLALLDID